jgi:hypothetical protein
MLVLDERLIDHGFDCSMNETPSPAKTPRAAVLHCDMRAACCTPEERAPFFRLFI